MRCADGRNHELLIVSLICETTRRPGKQYIKRMLPWFVIPECNIRLDLLVHLLKLVERHLGAGMRLAHEQADAVIGSASERTVARHLEWLRRLIAANVLKASELVAECWRRSRRCPRYAPAVAAGRSCTVICWRSRLPDAAHVVAARSAPCPE